METIDKKWYRADFTVKDGKTCIESEYYMADDDFKAMVIAREFVRKGVDFTDIGHVEIELTYIAEVDETQETWPEKRTVYY